jgi:hypothetical protein
MAFLRLPCSAGPLSLKTFALITVGVAVARLRGCGVRHSACSCGPCATMPSVRAPPTRCYLAAFVIAGGVAGLAGGLYVGRAGPTRVSWACILSMHTGRAVGGTILAT